MMLRQCGQQIGESPTTTLAYLARTYRRLVDGVAPRGLNAATSDISALFGHRRELPLDYSITI